MYANPFYTLISCDTVKYSCTNNTDSKNLPLSHFILNNNHIKSLNKIIQNGFCDTYICFVYATIQLALRSKCNNNYHIMDKIVYS